MSGQQHVLPALYHRERPGTHFAGGWVGPSASLRDGKSRPHQYSIPDRPARSQSLHRLSYRAHHMPTFLSLSVHCPYLKFNFASLGLVHSYVWDVCKSYVHWTVHHLDSWIKRDQLDVTCFIISLFNAQHVLDVNTSILRSLRLICWVISWVVLLWFNVYWCYVVVWLGWCGIRMEALVLQPAYGYHTTPAKPQRNTNTHRTRAIQPMK